MSDDRSFMDKVLGRDEPRDDTGPVDTRDRPADTPAPRAHQDGPAADDVREPGPDRPIDGTQDQHQAQRMRPADPPVDVRRDSHDTRDGLGGRDGFGGPDADAHLGQEQRQTAGGGTQGFRDGHQAADGSPTTDVSATPDAHRSPADHLAAERHQGGEWSELGTGRDTGRDTASESGHDTSRGVDQDATARATAGAQTGAATGRADHGAEHGLDGTDGLAGHDRARDGDRRTGSETAGARDTGTHGGQHGQHGQPGQHGQQGEHGASLVASDRAEEYRRRWESLKAGFVDEPRGAVKEADELVGRVLDDVAELFARQRSELEADLRNEQASTEDLRQALGRYRSFFDRLLTV